MSWSIAALGDVAAIERKSISPSQIPSGSRYVGLEHIESGGASLTFGEVANGELASNKFCFGPDHILFGKLRPYLAKIVCPDFSGICSTDILPIAPGGRIDKGYLLHFLRRPQTIDWASARSTGANLPRLSPGELEALEIPLPPLDEQRRIAAILDKADALRRKRKRAIELLDGLAQSIFLEMFGGLKQGLDYKPIGSVCNVSSGSTPRREDESNFGGDICWVKTTEVRGDVINETEEKVTEKGAKSARLKLYPKGTVLIAMYGQGATRGKVGILGAEATTNQACAALVPGPKLNPVFLFHQLRQNYEKLRSLGRGGNQPNLNGELVKSFEISVPPLDRQSQFVEKIEKTSNQVRLMRTSLGVLEATFSSIQHRAFSEEL